MENDEQRSALVALIDQCYSDIRAGEVSSAVFGCTRIAKRLRDPHSFSFFTTLQENVKGEGGRALFKAFPAVEKDYLRRLQENSIERVIRFYELREAEREQLDVPTNSLLFFGANLMDSEIQRCNNVLATMELPVGMPQDLISSFYTESFTQKMMIIARISILNRIKASILSTCNAFLIEAENQVFTTDTARDVFAEISDSTLSVLRKISGASADQFTAAFKFFSQRNQEGYSASLLQIRRCLASTADSLCPPTNNEGLTRDKYLNRLCYYYESHAGRSPNVVQIEADSLEKLIRYLHERASKGVHSEISEVEVRRVLMMASSLLSAIAEVEIPRKT